ncbi:hypothetical protein ACN47E_009045 [Coniothyrium glycines]
MQNTEGSHQIQDLEAYRITSLPPDFFYIPNFITPEEEASILQKIPAHRWLTLSHRRLQAHPSALTRANTLLAAPLPPYLAAPLLPRFAERGVFAHTPHRAPNHVLVNEYRRGQGILPHEDGAAYASVVGTVSLGGSVCLHVEAKGGSRFDDDDGGGGEVERSADSASADKQEQEQEQGHWQGSYTLPARIFVEPRSLLVTRNAAYTSLLHGIAAIPTDEHLTEATVANWHLLGAKPEGGKSERGTRVSLTYRDVVKVSGAVGKVFGVMGGRRS